MKRWEGDEDRGEGEKCCVMDKAGRVREGGVLVMVTMVEGAVDLGMFQTSGLPLWALDRSDRELKVSVHGLYLTLAAVNKGMLEW